MDATIFRDADWAALLALSWPLLVALLLGWLLRRGLLALARRAHANRATRMRARIVEVVAVPASFALPLVFLGIAISLTPLPGPLTDRLQHFIGLGVLGCMVWLAVRAVSAFEARILREHPVDVVDNLAARRVQTQTGVIASVIKGAIIVVGVALALMTFPAIRQIGATLLASAGVVGLVAGIAARPVFGNLIAGLQIALAQPIRLDDVVIVEGEWGRVEDITGTYVVVRIWDERRMVVPLQWFIEHPFENWTRQSAQLLGTAFLWLDYRTPMADVREALQRICESDARWDGRVCVAQVTETADTTIQVRLLVSAGNSGDLFDLRCAVRERMIDFLATTHPQSLPRLRVGVDDPGQARQDAAPPSDASPASQAAPPPPDAPTRSPGAEDDTGAGGVMRRPARGHD